MAQELSPGWIQERIFVIRGCRVMLDSDLACLYGVPTHRLNEQVRRNPKRFPGDFMLELTDEESAILISQFAISRSGWGGRRSAPLAFTEQGVAMLSSVLRSERAVGVNIAIVRAFVRLRETLSLHKDLAAKLDELEGRVAGHDEHIRSIFKTIRRLMEPPRRTRPRIGFKPEEAS